MKCPCHSDKEYDLCCGVYHKGENAPNALLLMRSRYSAYALKNIDYILRTTHRDHPQSQLPLQKRRTQIGAFSSKTKFNGLEILDFKEEGGEAFVTFRAILSQNGKDASFTEKSRFLKENGAWAYVSGEILSSP